ncbi:MAG: NAD-binding protein [Campylobacterota bacterium]|nr:NAD-binding protein [Campylobacterota bacterium]
MKNIIIDLAYKLEASKRYYNTKHFCYELLEDNNSPKKKYFDFFMIFLVLSTIAILIYEVNHKTLPWLDRYETTAIIIFIIEWLGRLWVSSHMRHKVIEDYEKSQLLNRPFYLKPTLKKIIKKKFAFIFSPLSIIDLLAILPYYRPLRILRILLLFRLFKILRYTNSIKQFTDVFEEKRFEFITLGIMFLMAVVFGSTMIFIYEGAGLNPNINNYFDAVYWSVITISTVGFGDISPVTIQGKVATLFLVIIGISVIAFFTSIVTTALNSKLNAIKEEKVIGQANTLNNFIIICGFGRMGQALANEFLSMKQKFIIIDKNEDLSLHSHTQKFLSIKGDATDPNLLNSININKKAYAIVALTDNDAVNLSIILTARSINPSIKIIARANEKSSKDKFYIAGANDVIMSNEISALIAAEYIGQPVAFEAIDDILLNTEGAVMDEIEILENSSYIDHKLNTIDFSEFNLTLLGIVDAHNRKKFTFNPKADQYTIKQRDILIVIGYKESIINFKVELLSSEPKRLNNDK